MMIERSTEPSCSTPSVVNATIADTAAVAFTNVQWPNNPFHKGEIALQQLEGVQSSVMSYAPNFVRQFMPEQHRQFFSELPFLVAAARDSNGDMWASLLERSDDIFVESSTAFEVASSPDPKILRIHALPVRGDALENAFQNYGTDTSVDLGLLGIMFETSRRNRVNGRAVLDEDNQSIILTVDQSFGNCPQYIKPRNKWFRRAATIRGKTPAAKEKNLDSALSSKNKTQLSDDKIHWIEGAETMFTATGYRGDGEDIRYGNDASHRGGPPGFVQVIQHHDHISSSFEIVWTEFSGNNHFNSLGNLLLDPRIGVCFPNFETGGLLQVTGTAVVEMGKLESGGRKVRMRVTGVNELPSGSLPIRWKDDDKANEKTEARVINIVHESRDVKSFYLKPKDTTYKLTTFHAGQHLPIELTTKDGEVLQRSYSLSASPILVEDGFYRISVKKVPNGKASSYLHEHTFVGDSIAIGKPAGAFTREVKKTPTTTVLLSAGIGITPLISMLYEIAAEKNPHHTIVWIHGTRDPDQYTFQNEIDVLHQEFIPGTIKSHVVFSQKGPSTRLPAEDIHDFRIGHITPKLVQQLVQNINESSIYMCGPPSFLAAMETGLEDIGVPGENIHYETF